ncbi:GntR family transcriptional regulator [Planobispora rosea]|uniref:GntR family transcriptional regulator n=1 Tax=Planobispora rosea TaxID=35762 RepID=A0A8J3WCL1_PLARO|nr:PLP-dependent aminotransferase family protein [Planobispora rosea]GGS60825.1 GntR family transcriptional regulator [Planobispora rosea]GIH83957.1 GntR family transcriptional regulator [Planobispora rosea]
MELFIDPDDERSLTRQLYEQIREAIMNGRLRPGDRLAPSRAVAAELGIARSTVTGVYGALAAEGYTEGRAGGGTVVAAGYGPSLQGPPPGALAPTPRSAALRRYDDDPQAEALFELRPGRIDARLFPAAVWRRCVLAGLRQDPTLYGDPTGTADLRAALTRWLAGSRGITMTPDQAVVTAGTGHAVDLVARVLLSPGDVAAVEEPGYPPVRELLRCHGVEVAGVPVDEHGIVVDAIPSDARLVYVTPSHQYPLGVVLSRRRRLELLRWAGRHGAAVVEDDYDSEFRHTARPLEPLHRLDRDGRVIYIGSFSKILSPGLRTGFLVAPMALVPAITTVRQAVDWCPPLATQQALTVFIDAGHLGRHLRRMRAAYTTRFHRIHRELLDRLPAGYRPLPVQAGLHVAVAGPETAAQANVCQALLRHGVLVGSLRRTYQEPRSVAGFLVGFGALPTERVTAAIDALVTGLTALTGR